MKRTSKGLARRAGSAVEAETIAVVCEGSKTEEMYFDGVRRTFRLSTARIHVRGVGKDPVHVVEAAMKLLPDHDHVWAVFDVEAPEPHARLNEAIRLAHKHQVSSAISNPCFEIWLLLHFQDQTSYLDNAAVRHELKKCACKYSDKGFDFDTTWLHHKKAIERAMKLNARQEIDHPEIPDRNPWTNVHKLVDQLLGLTTPEAIGR